MRSFETSNVDPALNRERLAHHEAGHAVVAWRLGIPIVELTIRNRAGHGELARGLAAIEEERGQTAMHVAAAVFFLAGQCAQMKWDLYCFAEGCEPDRAAARFHADALAGELKTYEDQAASMIARDWPLVAELAAALLERSTLSGFEVNRILTSSKLP
jgi:predicted trehalose synthase